MLVLRKYGDDYKVKGPKNKIGRLFGLVLPTLDNWMLMFYPNRSGTLFSLSCTPSISIARSIRKLKPDLVHLHWVSGGMIDMRTISN